MLVDHLVVVDSRDYESPVKVVTKIFDSLIPIFFRVPPLLGSFVGLEPTDASQEFNLTGGEQIKAAIDVDDTL